jgi:uncharacterized protein YdaT
MPWTKDDVDRFKEGLTDTQKERWVEIANSVLDKCLSDGGNQSECEASAIRQANGSVDNNENTKNMQKYSTLQKYINNNYQIRQEEHQGRIHWVVPVVMMKNGVHAGSHGPLLHDINELGRFPAAWNGMPIVVGHPKDSNGNDISANSPDVIERETVGRVFNTHVNGDMLKAEAWLDYNRLSQVSPTTLNYVEDQVPLDVSVGVFTDEEPRQGEWNGEQYEAIARNHRPDHLALLPGSQGACSWGDGCGIRQNEKKGGTNVKRTRRNSPINYEIVINKLNYSGTENTDWSAPDLSDFDVEGNQWDDLSQSDKAKVAGHYLIGSASVDSFDDLHYPVVDPDSGKLNENALRAVISGRGAALQGVSEETKSAARRRAYRLLNEEFDADLEVPDDLEAMKYLSSKGFSVNPLNNAQGYTEIAEQVQSKLDRMDTDSKLHFLEELFNDFVVYRVSTENGETIYYRRNYQVSDSGSVEFTSEPSEVRKNVEFINVNNMTKQEKVEKLVNNENNKFTSEDKEWLNNLEDSQLDKFIPEDKGGCCPDKVEKLINNENNNFTEEDRDKLSKLDESVVDKMLSDNEPKKKEGPETNKESGEIDGEKLAEALKAYAKKPEDFLSLMPKEMQDQMNSGLKLHREKRQNMITEIQNNSSHFSEDELKDMDNDMLEKIYNSVIPQGNYAPFGSPGFSSNQEEGNDEKLLPGNVQINKEKKE